MNHLYWKAFGTHTEQVYGLSALDTIGFINDSVRHPVSIGEGLFEPDNIFAGARSAFVFLRDSLGFNTYHVGWSDVASSGTVRWSQISRDSFRALLQTSQTA